MHATCGDGMHASSSLVSVARNRCAAITHNGARFLAGQGCDTLIPPDVVTGYPRCWPLSTPPVPPVFALRTHSTVDSDSFHLVFTSMRLRGAKKSLRFLGRQGRRFYAHGLRDTSLASFIIDYSLGLVLRSFRPASRTSLFRVASRARVSLQRQERRRAACHTASVSRRKDHIHRQSASVSPAEAAPEPAHNICWGRMLFPLVRSPHLKTGGKGADVHFARSTLPFMKQLVEHFSHAPMTMSTP